MRKTIPILLIGLLPFAGCLLGDRSHVLHLETDGSVTWIAHERAVRSDAGAAADRDREEAGYLDEARAERQPVARGLAKLGPQSLRATLLRDERPFQVMTEARFAALEPLLQGLLDGAGIAGSAKVARDGEETHLTLTLEAEDKAQELEADDDLVGLLADFEQMQFALARGKFVSATGFAISDDGAVATPLKIEGEATEGAPLVLSLVWIDGER
jgi:hypothetical protein